MNSFNMNGFGMYLNAVNMAYFYESASDEHKSKRTRLDEMEQLDDAMFLDGIEDFWELENMDEVEDDLLKSAVLSTNRGRHPYLFRSAAGVETILHPDALAHFNVFSHTESINVDARNWTTAFGSSFEVIDRDYMGIETLGNF